MAQLKIDFVNNLVKKVNSKEITIGKMVELLNEEVKRTEESTSLEGCPFNYCDSNPKCEGRCRYNKPNMALGN